MDTFFTANPAMDPFFTDPWHDYTSRPRYQSPVQHPNCPQYYSLGNRQVPIQPQPSRAPKVVSIPVNYAAPERIRSHLHSDAALKIQKVFRGYVVRKSVSKIRAINRDVDEISERVSKEETAELVRTNDKERLKVVEMLMSLLLKLDSVKGVDSGVRELRKSVIKKAIALQEKVDASAENHQTGGGRESDEPVTDYSGLKCEEESGEMGVNEREASSNSTERSNNEEMMEKMVKENQRMVGLINELVHRNEKQTRLLGSLSQRVEMLERALINERLRRKKRRQSLDCREEFF